MQTSHMACFLVQITEEIFDDIMPDICKVHYAIQVTFSSLTLTPRGFVPLVSGGEKWYNEHYLI